MKRFEQVKESVVVLKRLSIVFAWQQSGRGLDSDHDTPALILRTKGRLPAFSCEGA